MSNTTKDMSEKVNGFVLVNPVKVARAKLVAKEAGALLVEYDRLHGLILDGEGIKVPHGTFCTPKEVVKTEEVEKTEDVVEVKPKKRGNKK